MITGHNWTIHVGDVREKLAEISAGTVQLSMCSPPYWNLRDYGTGVWEGGDDGCDHKRPSQAPQLHEGSDGKMGKNNTNWDHRHEQSYKDTCGKCGAVRVDKQLGSEPTIEEYVETLVGEFDGVRRVLRDDGVCVVNMGDCLPDGNQCLAPHKFAIAMQAAGWILRETVVWAKAFSGQFTRGSCMPESPNGTRWERCRVKTQHAGNYYGKDGNPVNDSEKQTKRTNTAMAPLAQWKPCPGCPKCEPNGGLVLRRGSWRHTSAFEYVFVFVKSMGYYADREAVKEKTSDNTHSVSANGQRSMSPKSAAFGDGVRDNDSFMQGWSDQPDDAGRNPRNVLFIGTQSFPGAHFATYPEALVAHFVKAFTPDNGVCPACLAPWARVVKTTQLTRERPNDRTAWHEAADEGFGTGNRQNSCGNTVAGVETKTLGWRPTCGCIAVDDGPDDRHLPLVPIPATVLDPFLGSGTTLLVASLLGRTGIGIELSAEYAEMARKRITDPKNRVPRSQRTALTPLDGQKSLFAALEARGGSKPHPVNIDKTSPANEQI